MQLIEGDEKAVQELMDKIKADDRHRGILILQAGHSKEREFTDWAMAFRSPASQLANDLSDPAELAFTEEALARHSSNAAKLLRLFEKHFLRHTYNPRHSQYAKRGESPTSANEYWLPRMDSNHE
jgi:hypothetical protein